LPKSFLAAAAEGQKKLKIFSRRRRRERRRLTPLVTVHRLSVDLFLQKEKKIKYSINHLSIKYECSRYNIGTQ